MNYRLLSAAFTAAAGIALLPAADNQIRDVRFGVAIGIAENTEIDVEGSSQAKVDESSVRISVAYVAGVQPMQSWGAFIYGVGLDYIQGGGDGEGTAAALRFETTSMGFTVQGGYAYGFPAVPKLHLEGAFQLGYLVQDTNVLSSTSESDVAGDGFEYGLRASAFYTFPQQWQLGLDLRYIIDRTTKGNDSSEITYTTDGLSAGLSLGYRF